MPSVVQAASSSRPAIRALIVGQLAFLGAFLVVLLLYLSRMAVAGVGSAEMLTGAYDPKDVIPFGDHALNPFFWLYGVVAVLYLAGETLGPPLALVAVVLVARKRAVLPRTSRVLLLAGAVGLLLVLVVRFTPLLADMRQWWLD
ncbi:hypothetical protein [Micromonospora sp. 067-2]|uniref:hypothetical protein n=1 Tax=Micromonospora sp. 067-2 TaxID=2789270 RepID=UPI00397D8298